MIKVILASISATLIVVAFVASMFLNGILGLFGLASTSIETLSHLQESRQIVDTLKTKHKANKLKAPKKLAKRAGKRITASAVSAATIGTAAVVLAIATFEVIDYCEDKEELFESENILFHTDREFSYVECENEAKKDMVELIAFAKKSVPKVVSDTWHGTKDISKESWNDTKQITKDTWKSTKSASGGAWSYTKDISSDAWSTSSDSAERLWDSLINTVK